MLVPIRNVNAERLYHPLAEPLSGPEAGETDAMGAELFGLPAIYHVGCIGPVQAESTVRLTLPGFARKTPPLHGSSAAMTRNCLATGKPPHAHPS